MEVLDSNYSLSGTDYYMTCIIMVVGKAYSHYYVGKQILTIKNQISKKGINQNV